ncbi:hypothetical protein E2C01_041881 [Portunus trituberculatus]|uniref:Uncharacterized protein n=1 Tax=Portunus trituberculatus TaxID=210409 RepID=A0A5B7FRV6_PORTR|nr:hypothetical protein [Portunus trituberculatus]
MNPQDSAVPWSSPLTETHQPAMVMPDLTLATHHTTPCTTTSPPAALNTTTPSHHHCPMHTTRQTPHTTGCPTPMKAGQAADTTQSLMQHSDINTLHFLTASSW